jgi:inorganic triphosphatase YgiF
MGGDTGGFLEIERKYEVGTDFTMPALGGLPGVTSVTPPRMRQLVAVYHDTADRALAAAKITLRRRTGGSDDGWHLKLPAGADSRREIHAPLGTAACVPPELTAAVREWIGAASLIPIARLATTRVVLHLNGAGDEPLVEVADDRVTGSLPAAPSPGPARAPEPARGPEPARAPVRLVGRPGVPDGACPPEISWEQRARWREVEVELLAGEWALLEAADAVLRAAGARPASVGSKLARLLASASASRQSRWLGEPLSPPV